MKTVLALIISLDLALATAVHATPDDDRFQKIAKDYIEGLIQSNPEYATSLGDHRFDDKLTDYSDEAVAKALARAKDTRQQLEQFSDLTKLTGPNRVDVRILKDSVDNEIFGIEELKEREWNPILYNESLANSLYLLVSREFAPPEKRAASIKGRMEKIPAVIAQAKTNLKNPPRVFTETAIDQTAGTIALIKEGLNETLNKAPKLKAEIAPLQEKTIAALNEYKTWLENDLLPRSTADFRIGADKFRKKLRFALASDMSMEDLMKAARTDLEQTQKAIYEVALPLYKKQFPDADEATLADRKKVTAAVLDKLAEERPNDDTIVPYSKTVLKEMTDFVRTKNLVKLPTTPVDIIVMPEFKRGQAVAYCDSPGPLEKTGKTFYAVAPTPNDWNQQRKDSFFKEYNNYMVRNLTVHEAVPGHYLQLAHSNEFKAPTMVRSIFQSGTFIEGWAVYAEQFMAEAGYGGPEVKMQQLKMRLRVICNAIIDQSIHAANMSEQEALDVMMKEGFQQEGEAVGKWKRARLSSAQLSTYFVGVTEHLALREQAKARDGAKFNLRKYNDTVLSFGSPPVKYVREMMGL